MSLQLIYWIILLVCAVFGIAGNRLGPWAPIGNTIVLLILFLILGWAVFGAPVQA